MIKKREKICHLTKKKKKKHRRKQVEHIKKKKKIVSSIRFLFEPLMSIKMTKMLTKIFIKKLKLKYI